MKTIVDFLKGKKTYILAVLTALYAAEQYATGDITLSMLITAVLGTGSLASVRAAIAKVQ